MEYSVIVMSCDKYSDLWEPFVRCFERYWADCPAPIYLVTETLISNSKLFTETIRCGVHTEWTDRLGLCLDKIDSKYVIMLCDDYLLCDNVDNQMIEHLLKIAIRYSAGNLRMLPNPSHTMVVSKDMEIGECVKGVPYRIATQAGIWQKDYLKRFTKMQTSIWGFERMGSVLSNTYPERILCTLRHMFPFEDAVHKGKWERAGIRLCERNGITIDFSRRSVMTQKDYFVTNLKGLIQNSAPSLVNRGMNVATRIKRAFKT